MANTLSFALVEHLPERLSIDGFLRARRYYARDDTSDATKYLTLYEVANLSTLTSPAYMEKLNNPTPGTKEHIPTLATMNRAACSVVHCEGRSELKDCRLTIGTTLAMIEVSVLPGDEEVHNGLVSQSVAAFHTTLDISKYLMALSILKEDQKATEPGSSSQSYANVKLTEPSTNNLIRWFLLLEFSGPNRAPFVNPKALLEQFVSQLAQHYHDESSTAPEFEVYEFLCGASEHKT